MLGMKLVENPWLTHSVQAKKHRRKRINKKWLKKYGYITVPDKKGYIVGDTFYAHPYIINLIKQGLYKSD